MFGLLKKLFGGGPSVDLAALVKDGAIVVDVRTPAEYKGGHIRGSVNMPLDSLRGRVSELKKKGKPVITCCRSGARSGMAVSILKAAGIECYNGGAWDKLESKIS
jgi:phage shock protein E